MGTITRWYLGAAAMTTDAGGDGENSQTGSFKQYGGGARPRQYPTTDAGTAQRATVYRG